jgi:hypothetical protein
MGEESQLAGIGQFLENRFPTFRISDPPDDEEKLWIERSIGTGINPRVAFGDFTGEGTRDAAIVLQRKNPKKGSLGKVIALIEDGAGSFHVHSLIPRTTITGKCIHSVPYSRMLADFDESTPLVRRFRENPPRRPPEELAGRDCIYFGDHESDHAVFFFKDGYSVQAPFF